MAATCSTWLLLFAAAGAVMAAGAWLIGMQVLQAYTPGGGGWGPWWPPVATAPAPAPSGAAGVGSAAARVLSSVTGGSLLAGVAPVAPGAAAGLLLSAPAAPGVGGGWPCADGCVDLGWWGVAGGGGPHLGGPCICTPQLLKDLEQKIEQVGPGQGTSPNSFQEPATATCFGCRGALLNPPCSSGVFCVDPLANNNDGCNISSVMRIPRGHAL